MVKSMVKLMVHDVQVGEGCPALSDFCCEAWYTTTSYFVFHSVSPCQPLFTNWYDWDSQLFGWCSYLPLSYHLAWGYTESFRAQERAAGSNLGDDAKGQAPYVCSSNVGTHGGCCFPSAHDHLEMTDCLRRRVHPGLSDG